MSQKLMHNWQYVGEPQFWNPFSNSVVTWQVVSLLLAFSLLCCFIPPRKINLSAFCSSQPILKLLTTGRLLKGISSGTTFTLRLFMK